MNQRSAQTAVRSRIQKGTRGPAILKGSLASASRRQLTAELSLAFAVVAALWIGDLYTALSITIFALLARITREKALAHGRRSLHQTAEQRFLPMAVGAAEKALQVPAPVERTADWLSRFLVCLSLSAAVVTLLSTKNVRAAIAVIVVGGGCGLASGTWLVILGAMARAAQGGALISATTCLEELANIDVAVLDETAVPAFRSRGTFNVWPDGKSQANTMQAVRRLSRMNLETILFTDKLEPVGKVIGEKLGISFVEAELFPEDKRCKIAALRRKGRRVAMLSDAANAGPAVVEADVGVVIGSGAGVPKELGDVTLSGDSLSDFVELIAVARRGRGIVNFNFLLTTLVASVGIGLAMSGRLNPVWGLAIRFTSELAVLLNATRLVPVSVHTGLEKSVDSRVVPANNSGAAESY